MSIWLQNINIATFWTGITRTILLLKNNSIMLTLFDATYKVSRPPHKIGLMKLSLLWWIWGTWHKIQFNCIIFPSCFFPFSGKISQESTFLHCCACHYEEKPPTFIRQNQHSNRPSSKNTQNVLQISNLKTSLTLMRKKSHSPFTWTIASQCWS